MTEASSNPVAPAREARFDLAEIKQLEQGLISSIVLAHLRAEGDAEDPPVEIPPQGAETLRQELALRSARDLRTVYGLAGRFGLDEIERDALLLAFAAELDPRNKASFARASKPMTHEGRPTIGLIAHLLSDDLKRQLAVRAALGRRGRLRRFRLIDVTGHPGWPEADSLIAAAPVVRDLLLGHGFPPAGRPVRGVAEEAPELAAEICVKVDRGDPVMIVGENAPDRRSTAASLAARRDLPALLRRIAPGETRETEIAAVADLVRDALLVGAVPVAELDDIDARHLPALLSMLLDGETAPRGSLLLLVPHDLSGAMPGAAARCVVCEAVPVGFPAIRRRWQRGLAGVGMHPDDALLDSLAGAFRLEPWAVDAVAERALSATKVLDRRALSDAARSLAGRTAVTHARRVAPRYRLEDMVLPEQVREHLALLMGFAAERERLLYRYGYARRFTLGHGLVALLSGESGTGKTMAAEVLAGALQRDLYIVDLSQLVSKWVGETEKHIDQVFTEAEQAHGVLLFDEADALFSSRTNDISSSNDRYANMEVGYLLQRIESFRGVAVLTTNLSQSIDDAFLRRFHFRIDVPRPTAELRAELWKKMLPEGAIDTEGLDLQRLARDYDLTGGNIRNALMKATFLADRDRTPIAQRHLVEAAALECVELGRLV